MVPIGYLNTGVFVSRFANSPNGGGRLDLCGGTVTRGNIMAGACLDLAVY
jgi:hypothetical protein